MIRLGVVLELSVGMCCLKVVQFPCLLELHGYRPVRGSLLAR